MADAVTRPTDADPVAFVDAVGHPVRRRDAHTLLALYARVTGQPAVMWGPSIVGFGTYRYRYASGRTGQAPAAGFSPRAAATTLHLPMGVEDLAADLDALGPHRRTVSCVHVTDLTRLDAEVLERVVARGYAAVRAAWPEPA